MEVHIIPRWEGSMQEHEYQEVRLIGDFVEKVVIRNMHSTFLRTCFVLVLCSVPQSVGMSQNQHSLSPSQEGGVCVCVCVRVEYAGRHENGWSYGVQLISQWHLLKNCFSVTYIHGMTLRTYYENKFPSILILYTQRQQPSLVLYILPELFHAHM